MSLSVRSADRFDVSATFAEMKSDYAMAKETQYMRSRPGLALNGSSEDYHFRNEPEYFKALEWARDFDRNDMHVSSFVDTVVRNTLQGGFELDPQTGSKRLNRILWDLWHDWSHDPMQCDVTGQSTFDDLGEQVFRSQIVDGEIYGLHTDLGSVQLIESHLCKSPSGAGDYDRSNIVLGVELDDHRKPVRYHFAADDIDPRATGYLAGGTIAFDAFDARGRRQVMHILSRRRTTQTRGVTAFRPIFTTLDKIEDITFAKLVQQQMVSCFAIFVERAEKEGGYGPSAPLGEQETQQKGATVETIEGVTPGLFLRGQPGEKLSAFSPNVPNAEFFQHYESTLQIVAINLGIPLMMALMRPDGSYSAYRGAIDQARIGFRKSQRELLRKFYAPTYRWLLDRWADESPTLDEYRRNLGGRFYQHRWNKPNWPYIEPVADAQAALLRLANGLVSPSELHAERGRDWEDVVQETIRDNVYGITQAKKAAAKLNAKFADDGMPVHYRELLPLPTATGQSISIIPPQQQPQPQQPQPGGTPV